MMVMSPSSILLLVGVGWLHYTEALNCYHCAWVNGSSSNNKSSLLAKFPFDPSCQEGDPSLELSKDCDTHYYNYAHEAAPEEVIKERTTRRKRFTCASVTLDGRSRGTGDRVWTTVRTCIPTTTNSNNPVGTVVVSSSKGYLQNVKKNVEEPALKKILAHFADQDYEWDTDTEAVACNTDHCNKPNNNIIGIVTPPSPFPVPVVPNNPVAEEPTTHLSSSSSSSTEGHQKGGSTRMQLPPALLLLLPILAIKLIL